MSKKKILVICQHFWPESFRINDLCDGFIDSGYSVDVLCGIPNYPKGQYYEGYGIFKKKRQAYRGINIRRCFEINRGNNSNARIFFNYISFPIFSLFHLPYLLTQKYDKIFLYQLSPVLMSICGILLGKIKRIETVMYVLDLWPENLFSVLTVNNSFLKKIAYSVSTWHYRHVDKLIAISYKMRDILLERSGLPENKIVFIPQCCEKIYEIEKHNENLDRKFSGGFNMVFTGNISPAQSFETVIAAAVQLELDGYKNIRWIIVGDGMSKEWLKKEVDKACLGHRFYFEDPVKMDEVSGYTGVADALFACLVKSNLLDCTIPAKVFSYFAAGKPMILAMDGEISKIFSEANCGFVGAAGDSSALCENIKKLYALNKQKRDQMGKNAKEYYFEHFERNKNFEILERFIFSE